MSLRVPGDVELILERILEQALGLMTIQRCVSSVTAKVGVRSAK